MVFFIVIGFGLICFILFPYFKCNVLQYFYQFYIIGRFYAYTDPLMGLNSMSCMTPLSYLFSILISFTPAPKFKFLPFQVCCNHERDILCTTIYGMHFIYLFWFSLCHHIVSLICLCLPITLSLLLWSVIFLVIYTSLIFSPGSYRFLLYRL